MFDKNLLSHLDDVEKPIQNNCMYFNTFYAGHCNKKVQMELKRSLHPNYSIHDLFNEVTCLSCYKMLINFI